MSARTAGTSAANAQAASRQVSGAATLDVSEGLTSNNIAVTNWAAGRCASGSGDEADDSHGAHDRKHQARHSRRPRTKGHTNADFPRPLHEAVVHHSVEPDDDEGDGDEGEERGKQRERPVAYESVVDQGRLQGDVTETKVSVCARELFAKDDSQRSDVEPRPHLHHGFFVWR